MQIRCTKLTDSNMTVTPCAESSFPPTAGEAQVNLLRLTNSHCSFAMIAMLQNNNNMKGAADLTMKSCHGLIFVM